MLGCFRADCRLFIFVAQRVFILQRFDFVRRLLQARLDIVLIGLTDAFEFPCLRIVPLRFSARRVLRLINFLRFFFPICIRFECGRLQQLSFVVVLENVSGSGTRIDSLEPHNISLAVIFRLRRHRAGVDRRHFAAAVQRALRHPAHSRAILIDRGRRRFAARLRNRCRRTVSVVHHGRWWRSGQRQALVARFS